MSNESKQISCERCKKCFKQCKAECCIFVPMTKEFIEQHLDKVQHKIHFLMPHFGDHKVYIPVTHISGYEKDGIPNVYEDKQVCPFLDENHRCVVYEERPELCKMFGTTMQPDNSLTCHYHLGKNYSFPPNGSKEKIAIDEANKSGKYLKDLFSNPAILHELGFN